MTERDPSGGAGSGQDIRDELKGDANRLKDTAARQGEAKAAQGKEQAAGAADATSSAMDAAAKRLRDDDDAPAWLASAFSSAAQQAGELAEQLHDKSPRDIARETRRFARRNPAAFLAASAAAGFAAARFLRAGAEYHEDDDVDTGGSSTQRDQRYYRTAPGQTGTGAATGSSAPGSTGGPVTSSTIYTSGGAR
jgi:hypothetical protein